MPPCFGVSSDRAHSSYEAQDSSVFFLQMPAWKAHNFERIAEMEQAQCGLADRAPCMRDLVYRRTLGSLRITAPIPRTWIPVKRDMPQIPTAGTPATSGTVHAVFARVANQTKVVWWGWARAVEPAQL